MPDHLSRMVRLAAASAAAVLLLHGDAHAHKVRVFAAARGQTIRGEAYFSGGGRPKNVEVLVVGSNGRELGTTRTDEKGAFEFTAMSRCDHTFIVDTGDGHRAEYTVRADELPKSLPVASAATGHATSRSARKPSTATSPAATGPTTAQAVDQTLDALLDVLAGAVRKELAASEERIRVRDVIAGIGYIFGVMGLVMMWKYRRKPPARENPGR